MRRLNYARQRLSCNAQGFERHVHGPRRAEKNPEYSEECNFSGHGGLPVIVEVLGLLSRASGPNLPLTAHAAVRAQESGRINYFLDSKNNGPTDGRQLVDAMKGLAWVSPAAQFRSTQRPGK
jgi:hypothetical protein